jgi:hypothetical protein
LLPAASSTALSERAMEKTAELARRVVIDMASFEVVATRLEAGFHRSAIRIIASFAARSRIEEQWAAFDEDGD